ncbi:hypothetical protein FQA39_LY12187 [Lamprigera yunnana]|nr:hypothetical protein FQA39_LY12187 [Lamprigera yunnana]
MMSHKPSNKNRAQKRLELSQCTSARESFFKGYAGRKAKNELMSLNYETPPNSHKRKLWMMDSEKDLNVEGYISSLNTGADVTNQSFFTLEDYKGMSDNFLFDKKQGTKSSDLKNKPVELIISNLDMALDKTELWSVLLSKLKQYVMVLHLAINFQSDGLPIGIVKVATQQEAQLVISQLHHQRLGNKRITVSYTQSKSDSDQLRFMIIALLREVPQNSMPLFKFFELAETRYHCSISLSEVNKLKDICKISEGHGGRMISLTPEACAAVPACMESFLGLQLYCSYHCPNGLESSGWGEALDLSLPNINISLKLFKSQVIKLLDSHLGCLPLLSFPVCYSVDFGPLPEDECGVPLEHLVTCIPNVALTCNNQNKNIKYLSLKNFEDLSGSEDLLLKTVPPTLMTNIAMFCREVVDLLKTVDNCQLPMRRYIPTYHHHFGRQCRVADYGFTRLVDLFEAISHIVQVRYDSKRIITLTHSAQVRRFTSDLLRLLKGQASKRVAISSFSTAYEKTFRKTFNAVEYGLCNLDDLLAEVPEGTVVITDTDIAIPKREQTTEEIKRTKEFSLEVKQLLSLSPYCSMIFNKFVPAYHHHFGRQCKVSEYGFTKLVELFEAISHTVDLEGSSDVDRKVKLKLPLALNVLGDQIHTLIKESNHQALYIEDVLGLFTHRYGYTLKPEAYDCKDYTALAFKLNNFVRVIRGSTGTLLTVTEVDLKTLEVRVWTLLLNPPHMCTIRKLIYDYHGRFFDALSLTKLEQLKHVVVMTNNGTETELFLTPLYILAARLYHLLFVNGGCILLCDISGIFLRKFGIPLSPLDYGMNSFEDLFWQMSFSVTLKGNGKQLSMVLNKDLADYGVELPSPIVKEDYFKNQESFNWPPPLTYLSYKSFYCFSPLKSETPPLFDRGTSFSYKNEPGTRLGTSILPLNNADDEGVNYSTRLCSYANVLSSTTPKISSPHPTDLPTPDKLISPEDSGLNSSRYECSTSNIEICLPENQQFSLTVLYKSKLIMDVDFNKNCPIKSEVIVNETFSFCEKFQDYASQEFKSESLGFKEFVKYKAEYMNIHAVPIRYFCNECTYKTLCKRYLKDHVKVHSGIEYICKDCDYKSLRKSTLKEHMRIHTADKYECSECDYKTSWKHQLKIHMRVHTGDEYKCKDCDYKTLWKNQLKMHSRIHTGDEYRCNECGYKTPWKNQFKTHVKIHTGDEYKCKDCDYKTRSKYYVKEHMKIHTGDEYKCGECDYKTWRKDSLKEHTKIHMGEEYKCEECDYKTPRKRNINAHMKIHMINKCKCNHYDGKTLWKPKLKMDMKIYMGDKYKCKQCDYETARKDNLKEHKKINMGDEYKCKECNYKTPRKRNINAHMRIHTSGEYKCNECDYKTLWKHKLKTHVRIHTGDEYKCEECDYKTIRIDHLKRHLKIH